MICEACGGVHQEHDKTALLKRGEWRASAQGDGRTAGFHLSALYSPWETWAEIAIEHGKVRKDPPRLALQPGTARFAQLVDGGVLAHPRRFDPLGPPLGTHVPRVPVVHPDRSPLGATLTAPDPNPPGPHV